MSTRHRLTLAAVLAAAFLVSAEDALKDVFAGRFRIGAAFGSRVYTGRAEGDRALVERHFNAITPENEMKPASLQPREGAFRFDVADRFVAFGETNRMKIIGHCLVWHQQTPKWFFEGRDGKPVDRETLIARMHTHIRTVVGRYRGRVRGWDVVNEAFDDHGALRDTPWSRLVGPDFVELAFRFAHEADPDAELYYNDFGMASRGKREGVVRMIRDFRAKGVRIDGVGMQTHVNLHHPSLADYEASLAAFAAEGVKVMVTEMDISVLPAAWGLSADVSARHDYQEKYNPWRDGVLPDEIQQRLARRYEDFFRIYLRHADAIDRVTFWGVTDATSWLNDFPVRGRTDYPLLFDRAGQLKPCGRAVLARAAKEK